MTTENKSAHREFEVDHEFGKQARSGGGISRTAALARAAAEIERVKPQVSEYIKQECQRLDTALISIAAAEKIDPVTVAEAYTASQHVRDVAESIGYPLVGLIASNLCTIFEAVESTPIEYPTEVIDCHHRALRLALTRPYRGKQPTDFPELSAGLLHIAKIARAMSAAADLPEAAAPETAVQEPIAQEPAAQEPAAAETDAAEPTAQNG
jgi:hypothetical protein